MRSLRDFCQHLDKDLQEVKTVVKSLQNQITSLEKTRSDPKVIEKLAGKIDKLEPDKFANELKKVQTSVASFADVAKATKVQAKERERTFQQQVSQAAVLNYQQRDTNRFKILIQATEEEEVAERDSEKIRTRVMKKVPAAKIADKKGKVLAVRKLKGAICVEATAENKKAVFDLFAKSLASPKLEVKEVSKDIVTVKMASVPRDMTNDEICGDIAEGLGSVTIDKVKDNIQFLRRQNSKQWGRSLVFARIGGDLADRVINKKEFYMGYSGRVQIVPSICIMSCAKCGDLNHSQRFCDLEKLCFSCGKGEHLRGKCKLQEKHCVLCARRKKPATHGYMSAVCPIYREAVERHLAREGCGLGESTLEEYLMAADDE